jgi:hypothetical protein
MKIKIMDKLNTGQDQSKYDERLKNNPMQVILHQRDKDAENCHCRVCSFSDCGKGMLRKAKLHASKTGHTIDVYYETWREVTYYKK